MLDSDLLGRLHPLVLHLPIGLLLGALVLELLTARGRVGRPEMGLYLWLAAVSAVVAAGTGWLLGHEDGYGGATVERHEQLGIAVAVGAVLSALLHDRRGRGGGRQRAYRVLLGLTCVLLLPAGHLGATLTHGEDWLAGPRRPARERPKPVEDAAVPESGAMAAAGEPAAAEPPEPTAPPPSTYAARIAPILEDRCTSCHGASKHKGGLRLDSPEALLAGGDSGPALVPGDVAASLFLERALLPLEHDDHMPPEGKPQPDADELATLTAWVAAGAPFEGVVELEAPAPGPQDASGEAVAAAEEPVPEDPPVETARSDDTPAPLAPPSTEALAALDEALVHREALPEGGLRVSVAAVARDFGDAEVERLLVPLGAHLVELSLARSEVTDAGVARVATFAGLRALDLRATAVTAEGVAALAALAELEDLVLAQTDAGDAALEALVELPALRRAVVWRCGATPGGIAALRAARPELVVVTGDEPPAEALEAEQELTFTSDRPLPDAALPPEELRPVNATCPVSGSPVNPKYSVVHGGRVVGFCCPNCPKEFWSKPEEYEGKLE